MFTANAVRADVITFEGHFDDGGNPEFQDGFVFNFDAQGWGIFTDPFIGGGAPWVHNGTTRLVASGDRSATAFVDFSRTDAAHFSLNEIDAATMFPGFSGRIEVIGTLGAGGTVSSFFDVFDSFGTYALPATFTDLVSVRVRDTFSGNFRAEPGFSIDNIVFNGSSVPEPSNLIILCVGAIGFAGIYWLRRN